MGHFPHPGHNVTEREEITRVCGAVMDRCMIGMGDWNAADPSPSWATLIGGKPALVAPRSNTCCYPFTVFSYDHTVTNIAGARSAGETVLPYQLNEFSHRAEHHPTSVQLQLPG